MQASREEAIIDWVCTNDGKVESAVKIDHSKQNGWFLSANHDVSAGSTLITLPESCQIYEDASSDPIELQTMIQKIPEEFWVAKVSLKLLLERMKADKSHFSDYLNSLPVGVPGVPIFFSPNAVSALEYPPLIQQINKRCKWLLNIPQDDIQALFSLSGGIGYIPDTNLLGWSLAIVSSRAFKLKKNKAAMLPLIDICNHCFDANCKVLEVQENAVELKAIKDIKEGSPLMLNYGQLGNDDLLLDYGFFIQDNPYDFVELKFTPETILAAQEFSQKSAKDASAEDNMLYTKTRYQAQDPELVQWKENKLRELKLLGPAAELNVKIRKKDPILDPRLIGGVRILLSDIILQNISLEELCSLDGPLGKELESAIFRTLGTLLFLALGQFSTNVESDIILLKNESITDTNEQLAIEFRVEKKHLLLSATNFIAKQISTLSSF